MRTSLSHTIDRKVDCPGHEMTGPSQIPHIVQFSPLTTVGDQSHFSQLPLQVRWLGAVSRPGREARRTGWRPRSPPSPEQRCSATCATATGALPLGCERPSPPRLECVSE